MISQDLTLSSLRQTKGSIVLVRVAVQEIEVRRQVKGAGGVGNPDKQAWEVRYDHAVALGVTDRILEDALC